MKSIHLTRDQIQTLLREGKLRVVCEYLDQFKSFPSGVCWVREAWQTVDWTPMWDEVPEEVIYEAGGGKFVKMNKLHDGNFSASEWRSSYKMPIWASRMFVNIVPIREIAGVNLRGMVYRNVINIERLTDSGPPTGEYTKSPH